MRAVDKNEADEFVKNSKLGGFFETSAKEKTGISEAFAYITKKALENVEETEPIIHQTVIDPKKLMNQNEIPRSRCC